MIRLTRHDYDLMFRVHTEPHVRTARISNAQLDKLVYGGYVTDNGGKLALTAFGREQLDRVRGVGGRPAKLPVGYMLMPKTLTPEMIEGASSRGVRLTQTAWTQILHSAPKLPGY